MKQTLFSKVIYIILFIFQFLIISSGFILEYLSDRSAGVMHHIYYKKYKFENGIFSQSNLESLKLLIVILLIVLITGLIFAFFKKYTKILKYNLIMALVLCIGIYIILNSLYFRGLISFYYFIISFLLSILLQLILLIINYIKMKISSYKR